MPSLGHILTALGLNLLPCYDQMGTGLSIGNPEDLSIEAQANDLLSVVDAAAVVQFPLIAASQGVPVAIHFAAHHPERVTCLVIYGGFVHGRLMRGERHSVDEANALLTRVRAG